MRKRLTQATVNRMPSPMHPIGSTVVDGEVPGLRVVVGSKSCTYKLVGKVAGSKPITVTIARTDEIPLAKVRDKARELRLKMRNGIDPRLSASAMPNLRQAGETLLDRKADGLQPRTVRWYKEHLTTTLKPLLDTPIDKITPAVADRLHQRISTKSGNYHANGAMRALRAVLNFAAKTHDLPPNPISRGGHLQQGEAEGLGTEQEGATALLAMPRRTRSDPKSCVDDIGADRSEIE